MICSSMCIGSFSRHTSGKNTCIKGSFLSHLTIPFKMSSASYNHVHFKSLIYGSISYYYGKKVGHLSQMVPWLP